MINIISLVRGDTDDIKINFLKDGQEYIPSNIADGDIFTFTVKKDFLDGNNILQKKIIYPDLIFKIEHLDTKDLEFGAYKFDIEYRKPDASVVKTLVVGLFNLGYETTY